MKITIGVIADHYFFREGIELLLHETQIEIVMQASNGQDFRYRLEEGKGSLPGIMLIETDMPVMSGIETTMWMKQHHPSVKLIAISLTGEDRGIIKMLKAGCRGYLYKTMDWKLFAKAIQQVATKGYYNPEANDMLDFWEKIQKLDKDKSPLSEDKQRFLELACSDLGYEQICAEMNLTPKQANRYIDALFRKFHVTGRNGLVFEAMRKGFVRGYEMV